MQAIQNASRVDPSLATALGYQCRILQRKCRKASGIDFEHFR